MPRGVLTPEVQVIANKHIGRDISLRELRMIPYVHYLVTNHGRVDPNKVNQEERAILSTWRKNHWIDGGASDPIEVTHPFWEFMCEILFESYVRSDGGELECVPQIGSE